MKLKKKNCFFSPYFFGLFDTSCSSASTWFCASHPMSSSSSMSSWEPPVLLLWISGFHPCGVWESLPTLRYSKGFRRTSHYQNMLLQKKWQTANVHYENATNPMWLRLSLHCKACFLQLLLCGKAGLSISYFSSYVNGIAVDGKCQREMAFQIKTFL